MLISTFIGHVKVRRSAIRGHPGGAPYLPGPAPAAGSAGGGAALRRGAATAGADEWPVLAADVAQPPGAGEHRQRFGFVGHGPNDLDCQPEAAPTARAGP